MAGAKRGLSCLVRSSQSLVRPQIRRVGNRQRIANPPPPTRTFTTTLPARSDSADDDDPSAARKAIKQQMVEFYKDQGKPVPSDEEMNDLVNVFSSVDEEEIDINEKMDWTVDDTTQDPSNPVIDALDWDPEDPPDPPEPKSIPGYFMEGEEGEDWDEDGEFEPNDISTSAHGELEQVRELREFARIAAWDMPLLWQHRRAFEPPTASTPIRFRYTTYMGETHPAARKVVMDFRVAEIPDLTQLQRDKLIKLLGARYNPSTGQAKMSSDRYHTVAQNKRALGDLLDKLLKETREGKDTFEDVPFDFRYHKEKKFIPFPEEWKMTPEGARALRQRSREAAKIEQEKLEAGQITDGGRLIAELIASKATARKEPVLVTMKRRQTTLR